MVAHYNKHSLSHNQITNDGASMLFDLLKNNLFVTEIYLAGNQLTNKCLKSFANYIVVSKVARVISFGNDYEGNLITDAGIVQIASSLQKSKSLRHLEFVKNKGLTDAVLPTLIDIVRGSKIETLNLSHTSIESADHLTVPLIINMVLNGAKLLNISNR